jgi:hypothetical protein
LVCAVNDAVNPEKKNSAFTEIFGSSYEKTTASKTTIKVISSQYTVENIKQARGNPNFQMLEKSIARLCSIFNGYTVHAVEQEVQALPKDENGIEQAGYYFEGKIDCILASPNKTEFAIVDYKTSSVPSNLFVKPQEAGKKENVIDFQMPMYIYLLENNVDEAARINVGTALFYSIKKAEDKPFLGQAPNNGKENRHGEDEAVTARAEFLKYAKRFYDEVSEENFAVDALNQSRAVCAAKGEFDNCIDYQAICRRYFAVAGEQK